jgi:ABC-2 type transport system ATP-binding protein
MNRSDSPPDQPIIELSHLTRHYGRHEGLTDVSLQIPNGVVFGLVGENGSGKTTLIKHVLGLLKPQSGCVRVLGMDPTAEPVKVLSQIGFYSEELNLPGWMTVAEHIRVQSAFYSTWDPDYADLLRDEFELNNAAKIKTISRGARAKLGLLTALAHRPKLLVLDEPSSGLDPLARRGILEAVFRSIADEGRTVLFSSHLMDEIERVADSVGMLANGKLVLCDKLDAVKESHHRLQVRFDSVPKALPNLESSLWATGNRADWTFICNGNIAEIRYQIQKIGGRIQEESNLSLDEIFSAQVAHARQSIREENGDKRAVS